MDAIVVDALVVLSVFALATLWRASQASRARRGLPFPPGPPELPVLGNLLQAPKSEEWIAYRDWSLKYGSDIVRISSFGTHTIIVNSARAACELFEKRSALYSDRPAFTAMTYLGYSRWLMGFIRYGPKWRIMRKTFHDHFRSEILAQYEGYQTEAVHALLRTLVTHPQDFRENIRHMAGKIIMNFAYGIEVESSHDPFVTIIESALEAINNAATLSGLLLDFIPILQYMPAWFPGFKKYAAKVRSEMGDAVMDMPWEVIQSAKKAGLDEQKRSSVAGKLLDKYGDNPDFQLVIKAVPANMYIAGADTTVSSITSFFMAMALYPEAQWKAQQELDSVLQGALPTPRDCDKLPYTMALVKEVFRWHPVTSLAIPHALTESDVYEGMFLPGGCTVIGNVWAILHDPMLFPSPEAFNPAHFISTDMGGTYPADACKNGEPPYPDTAFGFGRRMCPGKALAKLSVWMTITSVLSAFEITAAKDKNGKVVPIEDSWPSGVVGYPGPFECSIEPRREVRAAEAVIRMLEGQ